MSARKRTRKVVTLLLKVGISALALWFVFKKVNFEEIYAIIKESNLLLFILSVLVFNVSKIISTFRVQSFLKALGHKITLGYNIRLYYIGAFYNLFLPGSVGGDAIKVYLLKQKFEEKTRRLISVALLDRASGMAVVAVLASVLLWVSPVEGLPTYPWILLIGLIATYPIYYLVVRKLFPAFLSQWMQTNLISIAVQGTQMLFAFLLLVALGVEEGFLMYIGLFFVAAIAGALPISIGGLGAREAVFILAPQYMPVDEALGVTFSLLVFGTTAVSSFIGLFLSLSSDIGPGNIPQTEEEEV